MVNLNDVKKELIKKANNLKPSKYARNTFQIKKSKPYKRINIYSYLKNLFIVYCKSKSSTYKLYKREVNIVI